MIGRKRALVELASLVVLALVVQPARVEDKPAGRRLDRTKRLAVEKPTELLVKAAASARAAANPANPKVEPGKVKWHPSFAAACAAAKKSGKPVLLFQMMGKLDDQFC
jgi:hypothetical protein